ncbi:hypothetical protein, unlikely [Trypanosoma brucei gambiense DAL972]|uniref:T. brucei spp.-specific protein n=1 Tax=Trypanosoma brucei gambiense (strain MHOM/CI/86/DAL972) TaxID=679716 RepID=C9ZIQ5_TRYB9|nr:hypothetical protein, unlikely [Trypanosoma brucei gambiense DAL972]CBH09047.1 hypothetical protein, unlikely [Trypanosoma brucei gambiense DAL972]|eukprot:XP_011771488.1 hypothetical protein, unlikely [Trypanosoma brucei gambiense DAL972]
MLMCLCFSACGFALRGPFSAGKCFVHYFSLCCYVCLGFPSPARSIALNHFFCGRSFGCASKITNFLFHVGRHNLFCARLLSGIVWHMPPNTCTRMHFHAGYAFVSECAGVNLWEVCVCVCAVSLSVLFCRGNGIPRLFGERLRTPPFEYMCFLLFGWFH